MAQVQGLTQSELGSMLDRFQNYGDTTALTEGLKGVATGLRDAGTVNRQEAINKLMQNPPSLPAIVDANGNVIVDEDVDYSKLSEMIRPYDATLAMKYAEEGKKVDELRRKAELNLRVASAGKDIGKDYATKEKERYNIEVKSIEDEARLIEEELLNRGAIPGVEIKNNPPEGLADKYRVLNSMNFGQSPQKFNR